jgi:membrane-associated protein
MHLDIQALVQLVGYPGVVGMIFLESGVPFGFFLPGASLLFTAGLLAGQGYFDPWILVPSVTLAAILGDSVGYWFGARWGVKLFLRPDSRFLKHEHLERAKAFYDRYGKQAVFLARFVPVVRTFVPIVAGIVAMEYKTFLTFNVLGGVAWAASITALGVFLGGVPFIEKYFTAIILTIIVVTCIPVAQEYWKTQRRSREAAQD